MRLSILKDDPGYQNFEFGKYVVFLDGRPIHFCITADEEERFVLVYDVGLDNKPYPNKEWTEAIKKRLDGRVEIISREKL